MKILITILALVLTMNISVAATHNGVQDVLDEFSYAMTVEGAALDQKTAEATILLFHERLMELHKAGLSREEIVDAALARIADVKTAAEIRNAFNQVKEQNLSSEEARVLIEKVLAEGEMQGASWNGAKETLQLMFTIALVGTLVFGFIYVFTAPPECEVNPSSENCQD